MKTLHLHIGTYKTGTSSIQKTLYENQDLLNEHDFGVFYKKPDGTTYKTGTIANSWGIPPRDSLRLSNELASLPQSNVICSSEYFYRLNDSIDKEKPRILSKNLYNNFSKINIYCYIRRQDAFALSGYQQRSRMKRDKYHGIKALPILSDDMKLNYNLYENIYLKIFNFSNKSNKEDISNDFFKLLGLEKIIPKLKTFRINESLGAEITKVGHLIGISNINQEYGDIIRRNLDNTGKLLPSKKEAEEFYSHFIESNIMLNRRFKISSEYEDIFDHDFSMYPDEANDTWTEETANKAIMNILNAIPHIIEKEREHVIKSAYQVFKKHSSQKTNNIKA